MFDISTREDIQTGTCIIKDPATSKATDATITIAGPEHPSRQKIVMDRTRRIRAEVRKTGKLDITDPLEDRVEETEYLVACTLGWAGLGCAGQTLEYSEANARSLYTDPARQWLRAQVKTALDEAELFIIACATN